MTQAAEQSTSDAVLAEGFAAARARLPDDGAFAAVREQAFDAFARQGLPTRRVEDWKYTDLRRLMGELAPLASTPDATAFARARDAVAAAGVDGCLTVVLVDGVYAPDLSGGPMQGGIAVRPLREGFSQPTAFARARALQISHDDPMLALNVALATDGVMIDVADGVSLERPIHLVHVSTQLKSASYTRSFITLGRGARAAVIESSVAAGGAAYQAHDMLATSLGEGASLDHIRLMRDAGDAVRISSALIALAAASRLNLFNLVTGGAVSRYQAFVRFDGEGAGADIHGANLLRGTQHADATLFLDHAVPHCTSREVFRAVLDDRARSVFQGRIMVRPDAQKTDAKMMTRALLLSDEAEADSKPELEIYADDVVCGHGSTSGALDENLLFYLRARGLPEREAQALLIQAFIGDALEQIARDDLREHAMRAALAWLEERRT